METFLSGSRFKFSRVREQSCHRFDTKILHQGVQSRRTGCGVSCSEVLFHKGSKLIRQLYDDLTFDVVSVFRRSLLLFLSRIHHDFLPCAAIHEHGSRKCNKYSFHCNLL